MNKILSFVLLIGCTFENKHLNNIVVCYKDSKPVLEVLGQLSSYGSGSIQTKDGRGILPAKDWTCIQSPAK